MSAAQQTIELLRFNTCGSVDDGKSTLIGRLLYDSKSIMEDQMEALERSADITGGGQVNLANLTDGLRAEREQGITIDVAYRYVATPKRKFIVADTPGHVEYTRNMVTGASTANLSIVLVDARNGVIEQTRRHSYISALLGIPHIVFAVNKMDLVDWNEERFREIREGIEAFLPKLDLFKDVKFIPISALEGDNVVTFSDKTPWYEGPTLLGHIEWRIDVHFVKGHVGGIVQLAHQIAVLAVRADEAGNRDDPSVGEELGHLANAADILGTVVSAKAQILVQPMANIVAVQPVGVLPTLEQNLLKCDCDRALATTG